MSRKTTALIIFLVILTAGLVALALRNNATTPSVPGTQTPNTITVTPTPPAHTTLSFTPQTLTVAPDTTGAVRVMMDTQDNPVTVVQLELSYDPTQLTNVKVTPGTLFSATPAPILNSVDPKTGRITYMIGAAPGQSPYTGQGVVATVSFTTAAAAIQPVSLTLMKTSIVAARGIEPSVLKNKQDVTALITVAGTSPAVPKTPNTPAGAGAAAAPTQ